MSFRFKRGGKPPRRCKVQLSWPVRSLTLGKEAARRVSPGGGPGFGFLPAGKSFFYATTHEFNRPPPSPGGKRREVVAGKGRPGAPPILVGPSPIYRAGKPLSLGFFKRLIVPVPDLALVDGCKELAGGRPKEALTLLREAGTVADAAFLTGYLSLAEGLLDEAEAAFERALKRSGKLGHKFREYGIQVLVTVPLTPEVYCYVEPSKRGVLLGLVETYQRQGRADEAIHYLRRLRRLAPEDPVLRLSLAELLFASYPGDRKVSRLVARLGAGVENLSEIHAALLLYRARALMDLGENEEARDLLIATLRRRKNRSREVLAALRTELGRARCALTHEIDPAEV